MIIALKFCLPEEGGFTHFGEYDLIQARFETYLSGHYPTIVTIISCTGRGLVSDISDFDFSVKPVDTTPFFPGQKRIFPGYLYEKSRIIPAFRSSGRT